MCGDRDLIWLISSKGTPQRLQTLGPRSETPLEAACATGNLEVVYFILKQPWAEYGSAALCACVGYAEKNYTQENSGIYDRLVKRLLRKRRRTSEIDTFEATALALTVKYWYFSQELLHILLKYLEPSLTPSLDIPALETTESFRWRSENRPGKSPLHIAVDGKCLWVVKLLLNAGFRPDKQCFLKTLQLGAADDAVDITTAIWNANHPSTYDESRIARAFEAAVKSKQVQMAERLPEFGLHVDSRRDFKSGWTPLQVAAFYSDNDIIEKLIKAGANVNALPAHEAGATAPQISAMYNRLDIVHMLLEHGADVNAPGARNYGRTALEGAAEHGRQDMVQRLLYKGAETDGEGRLQYVRAVKFAQQYGHHAVARLLKRHREWTDKDVALMNSEGLMNECRDS